MEKRLRFKDNRRESFFTFFPYISTLKIELTKNYQCNIQKYGTIE